MNEVELQQLDVGGTLSTLAPTKRQIVAFFRLDIAIFEHDFAIAFICTGGAERHKPVVRVRRKFQISEFLFVESAGNGVVIKRGIRRGIVSVELFEEFAGDAVAAAFGWGCV